MKGTIDARIENAREKLLSSQKELAEHFTIVDLIRNDLSMVAKKVKVNRFRYIDPIHTHKNSILQMSSEIEGEIRPEFQKSPGDLLWALLPAGSISGAPKKKTVEIIRKAENYNRGFYTGIVGIFDGQNINSGVMIRFIEKTEEGLIYKSGGGITALSDCEQEYKELIDKIYVPFY
jgi:para-aminobenzoate synthetase component 1